MSELAHNPTSAEAMAPPEHQDAGEQARFLWLPVTEIRPYDRNPRRADNPETDRIRASIRADGMDQPLVVTQRPGDSQVMVQAGGNTRLRIVQALFAETGDPRFGHVHCLFRPWTRESDLSSPCRELKLDSSSDCHRFQTGLILSQQHRLSRMDITNQTGFKKAVEGNAP